MLIHIKLRAIGVAIVQKEMCLGQQPIKCKLARTPLWVDFMLEFVWLGSILVHFWPNGDLP